MDREKVKAGDGGYANLTELTQGPFPFSIYRRLPRRYAISHSRDKSWQNSASWELPRYRDIAAATTTRLLGISVKAIESGLIYVEPELVRNLIYAAIEFR